MLSLLFKLGHLLAQFLWWNISADEAAKFVQHDIFGVAENFVVFQAKKTTQGATRMVPSVASLPDPCASLILPGQGLNLPSICPAYRPLRCPLFLLLLGCLRSDCCNAASQATAGARTRCLKHSWAPQEACVSGPCNINTWHSLRMSAMASIYFGWWCCGLHALFLITRLLPAGVLRQALFGLVAGLKHAPLEAAGLVGQKWAAAVCTLNRNYLISFLTIPVMVKATASRSRRCSRQRKDRQIPTCVLGGWPWKRSFCYRLRGVAVVGSALCPLPGNHG
jgi:hypothetical protein